MKYIVIVLILASVAAAVYFSVKSRKADAVAPATDPTAPAKDHPGV